MYPVLTPLGLMTGKPAIKFAEEHGLLLNKYADGISVECRGLTPEEAKKYNPELIWIDIR